MSETKPQLNSNLSGVEVLRVHLTQWQGDPIKDDYNGKAIIDFNGSPLYAELAILRQYLEKGYDGVWVDTYRNTFRVDLPEKSKGVMLPRKIDIKYSKLVESNDGKAGCWDLLLWKKNKILFVELKRKGKDEIRDSQIKWFENALRNGYSINDFQIIEWDIIN